MSADKATLFRDLTEAQADGLACVVCNEDHTTYLGPTVPVGVSETGSQVFACETPCAYALRICGPGCCSPVLAVHDHCPGPRAGAEVVVR